MYMLPLCFFGVIAGGLLFDIAFDVWNQRMLNKIRLTCGLETKPVAILRRYHG